MTKLTDTLADPNYTPRVVQVEQGQSDIGNLAKVGASWLDNFDQAQRRAAAAANSGPKNNIALDEFAQGASTIMTGIPLNKKAAKILQNAEKLAKAEQSGGMSTTAFDLAMKNWYADVVSRYPEDAEEIMNMGAQRGLDHYYFREARLANEQANAQNTASIEANNTAYKAATDKGYKFGSFEETAMKGYEILRQDAALQMEKATLDKLKTMADISEPWWEDQIKQAEAGIIQNTMAQVHTAIAGGNSQLYNLVTAAAGSPDRQALLDANFDATLFDLDKMLSDINAQLNGQGRQIVRTGEDGKTQETRFVPVPKEAYEQARREIEAQKATVVWLRAQPQEKMKRWLETNVLKNKMKAQELIPNVLAMSDAFEGMTVPAIMETLMVNPGQFGLNPTEASYLLAEVGKGAKSFSTDSFQWMQKMTSQGQSPALSKKPSEALAGFMHNYNVFATFGAGLAQGAYTNEEDKAKAIKAFEDSGAALVVATRQNYNMSNINLENATLASSKLLQPGFLRVLDGYTKAGGDPEIAKMMGAQSAITAGTFIEALMSKTEGSGNPLLVYNKMTGKVEPQATASTPSTGYAYLTQTGIGTSAVRKTIAPATQQMANVVNNMLDYIDAVHAKYPVLKDEFLKDSKMSVRDVAATTGFDAYAASVQKKMGEQAAILRQEETLFRNANDKFDYYKDGSFRIDNSPSGDGGFTSGYSGKYNLTAKAPEELKPLIASAAEEAGLDEGLFTALIKNESAFNPKARGPSIPKYKGTPDEYAIGLGQLLPSTAKEVGVTDINDPAQNLKGAARYLKKQLDAFDGDARLALMAYNWGPENVSRWLKNGQDVSRIPKETREYVKRILGVDLTEQQ